jgi:aminopeptidase N
MYFKGSLMLHTLRNAINNDKLWFDIVYGIAQEFKLKVTSTDEIVQYINKRAGQDFTYFFNQYLRHPQIPVLQFNIIQQGKKSVLQYRWNADATDFRMPVKADLGNGKYEMLIPTYEWQTIPLKGDKKKFRVATELFYIQVQEGSAEKTKS